MPVKKNTTQKKKTPAGSSPARKSIRKSSKKLPKMSKEERASIKKAISSLPSYVIQTADESSWSTAPAVLPKKKVEEKKSIPFFSAPEKKTSSPGYNGSHFEKKKRKILWFGVGSIMLCVVVMWIYTVKIQVSQAKFSLGTEEVLWKSAKEDFDTLVKQPPVLQKPTEVSEEKIKEVLATNVASVLLTTSTSPTSTPESFSTSTTPEVEE